MNPAPHTRSRALTVFMATGFFAFNAWICRGLFYIEYLRFMGSIECAYFAIARFILAHPYDLIWFPLWYERTP